MNLETDRDIQKFFKNTSISNVIALKRMKYGITNKVYKVEIGRASCRERV